MFRFTIRDVLWLMVVVGLAIGWWLDRSSLAKLSSEFKANYWAMRHQRDKLIFVGNNPAVMSIPVADQQAKQSDIEIPPINRPLPVVEVP